MDESDSDWDEFLAVLEEVESAIGPFILPEDSITFRGPKKVTKTLLKAPYMDSKETAERLKKGEIKLRDPGTDTFGKVGRSIELHIRYIWCGDELSSFNDRQFTLSQALHQMRQFMWENTDSPGYHYTIRHPFKKVVVKPRGTPWEKFRNLTNKDNFFTMNQAHKEINILRNGCVHQSPKSWSELGPLWKNVCEQMDSFIKAFNKIV